MIAINKLLVMVFLVAFLCIDISPGLAQSNWQQQQWQQQQRQQEMLRQQQLQQQRMMEQQRQQQQIQKQQAQQRQMQQRQIQQQQGSAGLRQNSANRGFPVKDQMPRPKIVIKAPQSTTNNLKNSTNLSSRAQKAKQTAEDLAYKQKMKDRLFLIKKNKEERRLADLRRKEKERLDKEKNNDTKGITAYRRGTFSDDSVNWPGNEIKGKQWAGENPITSKEYAKKYGLPAENTGNPDWVVKGRANREYSTRQAPASHNNQDNTGGGTEILPKNPEDVKLDWFHMPDKQR